MVLYRRRRIADAPHFLTAALQERGARLLVEHIDQLRAAFRCAAAEHPFHIDAVVVLPDHFHLLCSLPQGDADFSVRMQTIRRRFTFGLANRGVPLQSNRGRASDIWQLRVRERAIRDDDDFLRHVDYIHYNPVKHGCAKAARDWPHSSFHRYLRQGLIRPDWGASAAEEPQIPTGG